MRRLMIAAAVLLSIGAGVGAASALVPQSSDEPNDDPAKYQPDGGPVAVHALADDPAGGPAWGVRVYRSRTGLTCPEAGRVQDGLFGRDDGNEGFTALPLA